MNERVITNIYRTAVLFLLSLIAFFQIQQRREIQLLGYAIPQLPEQMEVKVINTESEPLPISGSASYIGNIRVDNLIPVEIKNIPPRSLP